MPQDSGAHREGNASSPTHASPFAPSAMDSRPPRSRLDVAGAVVSCACACHCVALPAAVALAPALGLGAVLDERVEVSLLAITLLIGTVSLAVPACRGPRVGRWWRIPALFVLGALLLGGARLLESRGAERARDAVVLAGAGLIASAHLVNRRRLRAAWRDEQAACCACPGAPGLA